MIKTSKVGPTPTIWILRTPTSLCSVRQYGIASFYHTNLFLDIVNNYRSSPSPYSFPFFLLLLRPEQCGSIFYYICPNRLTSLSRIHFNDLLKFGQLQTNSGINISNLVNLAHLTFLERNRLNIWDSVYTGIMANRKLYRQRTVQSSRERVKSRLLLYIWHRASFKPLNRYSAVKINSTAFTNTYRYVTNAEIHRDFDVKSIGQVIRDFAASIESVSTAIATNKYRPIILHITYIVYNTHVIYKT